MPIFIGGGDGGWGGGGGGHFNGTMFERKGRDTLIEQSQYSEKQCSKLLRYVCVVINKEIQLVVGNYCQQVVTFFFFWSSPYS